MGQRTLRKPPIDEDAVMAGDLIEYSMTWEVSPTPGSKAWIKFGTTAAVRNGESAGDAVSRITEFVETELDQRINDLSK